MNFTFLILSIKCQDSLYPIFFTVYSIYTYNKKEYGYYNSKGYVMVEPRLIYAPIGGIYRSAKGCIQVLAGLYAAGGQILHGREKLYYSR